MAVPALLALPTAWPSPTAGRADTRDSHEDIALAILGAVVVVAAQANIGRRRGATAVPVASTASTGSATVRTAKAARANR